MQIYVRLRQQKYILFYSHLDESIHFYGKPSLVQNRIFEWPHDLWLCSDLKYSHTIQLIIVQRSAQTEAHRIAFVEFVFDTKYHLNFYLEVKFLKAIKVQGK